MIPDVYRCTSCLETYQFPFRSAYYYLGKSPMGQEVEDSHLLAIPHRPAWCKTCASLSLAEDILSLRDFENAYGAARAGKQIDYPLRSEHIDTAIIVSETAIYLNWRMSRRHAPRALCCGGTNFQYLDVAQPLLKHADCEFGFMEGLIHIGSHCGPAAGVNSPANIRLYDSEGELIGQLTWRNKIVDSFATEKLSYPHPVED